MEENYCKVAPYACSINDKTWNSLFSFASILILKDDLQKWIFWSYNIFSWILFEEIWLVAHNVKYLILP